VSHEFRKFGGHGAAIVADQNPPLCGCNCQDLWIFNAFQVSLKSRLEVNSGFFAQSACDDCLIQVSVGLVAEIHNGTYTLAVLAAMSLAYKAGSSTRKG
jgi:hypothetical protein